MGFGRDLLRRNEDLQGWWGMDEYVVSLGRIALMRDYDGKYINERYNGWDCDHARLE